MPQFVLLEHNHPTLHFDFMVECGDGLRTWRLDRIPTLSERLSATALPDHRLAYLEHEGPVSGNRGAVRRIDRGECTILNDRPGLFSVRLTGRVLTGQADLSLDPETQDCGSPDESRWNLQWQGSDN